MGQGQLTKQMDWVETARGIGMLLAVLACAIREEMTVNSSLYAYGYHLLWSIQIPLLFALSGFAFGAEYRNYLNQRAAFGKRIAARLLPLAVYTVAAVLLRAQLDDQRGLWGGIGVIWGIMACVVAAYLWLQQGKDSHNARVGLFALAVGCFLLSLLVEMPGFLERILKNLIWFVLGIELWMHSELLEERWSVILMTELMSWGVILLIAFQMTLGMISTMTLAGMIQQLMLLAALPPVIFSILRLARRLGSRPVLSCLGEDAFWICLLHQPGCSLLSSLLQNSLPVPVVILVTVCAGLLIPAALVRLCRKLCLSIA